MEDDTLRNVDDQDSTGFATEEDTDTEDTSESVGDDTTDGENYGDDAKTIPYERFKQVVDERNDLKQKYDSFQKASSKPKEDPKQQKAFDKARYTPEQIETIQNLAGIPELKREMQEYKKQVEERTRNEQIEKDKSELRTVLSDKSFNIHSVSEDLVQKQVLKWGQSEDPEKRWLATAPYKYILREMNEMQQSSKKTAPPKIEKGSDPKIRKPDAQENRTMPANSQLYVADLANGAMEYMKRMASDE